LDIANGEFEVRHPDKDFAIDGIVTERVQPDGWLWIGKARAARPLRHRPGTSRFHETAQQVSTAIYLAFWPCSRRFSTVPPRPGGVAGISDVTRIVAVPLGLFVQVGVVTAQLKIMVADSIGSSGLLNELSQRRLSIPLAKALARALA